MPNRVAAPRERLEPSNRLLAALLGEDLSRLELHLEAVPLVGGSVLFEVDEPLTHVHFVETGVVSLLTVFEKRLAVGAATMGREGAVGVATLLLGGDAAPGRFQVLVPGSALAMEVPAFRSALRQSPKLRMACEAHTRALFVQILQAVPCSKLHTVEQRCARWLLMCADQIQGETFDLPQGPIAEILGVPQSRVTAIACTLQQTGLSRYDGEAITVLDRRGLEAAACECYRIVRDRCERLLARAFE
jgi:CRP-like cAMP-binding protein